LPGAGLVARPPGSIGHACEFGIELCAFLR
jgi:hypothetical protein